MDQLNLFTIMRAVGAVPRCFTKLDPNPDRSREKPWLFFMMILIQKLPQNCDKTAEAFAASLISNGHAPQRLPAFLLLLLLLWFLKAACIRRILLSLRLRGG